MLLTRTDLELETLVSRLKDREIDLQPDFQRGEVWNTARQRRLVDTILRGWYIPPIHLISEPDTGNDLVLDGQQRLAAILAFFKGELPVAGNLDPPDDALGALDGLYYLQLPEEMQRRARRFPLSVITLTDYQPEEPYELFFRLNQHMTLTPPEKRNALYGPARDQIKHLIDTLVNEQLLQKQTVGFANRRLAYDDVLARVTLTVQQGTLRRPFSNAAIESFYRTDAFSDETLDHVFSAARDFLAGAGQIGPKLNKATLFTWVVFTHSLQSTGRRLTPVFLDRVEALRADRLEPASLDGSGALRGVMSVYSDRASYRVNDTLSILLRHLSLEIVWALTEGTPVDESISNLTSELVSAARPEFGHVMTTFLESTKWDLRVD